MRARLALLGLAVLLWSGGLDPVTHGYGPAAARADAAGVAERVEELGSEDANTRRDAYWALRKGGYEETPALLAARLPEFSLESQELGVRVLADYGTKEHFPALRTLLECSSAYLQVSAALLLHGHGEKGMLPKVLQELGDEALPPATRALMVKRLRNGQLPAAPAMMRAVLAPIVVGADAALIRETATVMDEADAAAAIPAFEALLTDDRAGTRALAAAFLRARGQARDADLAAALRLGKLESSDVYRLDDFLTGSDAEPVDAAVVDALLDASRVDANASSLRAIVQLLGRLKDPRALPRLEELTEYAVRSVARAASRAIVTISGAKSQSGSSAAPSKADDADQIAKMLKDRDAGALKAWLRDESATRRLAAADALRRMDDHSGLDVVLLEMGSKVAATRREAVSIAGAFRVEAAVPPLIDATTDEDTMVRWNARTALNSTLGTLFPQRRFRLTLRGANDLSAAARAEQAERLRTWWAKARTAPW